MIGLAHDAGLGYVSLVREDDKLGKGMALYRVDLSRPGEADPAR